MIKTGHRIANPIDVHINQARPNVFNLPLNPMNHKSYKCNYIKARVENTQTDYIHTQNLQPISLRFHIFVLPQRSTQILVPLSKTGTFKKQIKTQTPRFSPIAILQLQYCGSIVRDVNSDSEYVSDERSQPECRKCIPSQPEFEHVQKKGQQLFYYMHNSCNFFLSFKVWFSHL